MSSHRVTLQPSGTSFDVPEGKRILASGLSSGISMPYACRMGCCRTCRGKVVAGNVDHGDVLSIYLTDEDKAHGYALLCSARPLTDLVIELDELPALEPPSEYDCMVKRIRHATPDVAIVDLRLPLHEPMRFAAGQYIDILLENGARRSYSIASASAVTGLIDLQIHIKHVKGGLFTDTLFGGMKERTKLRFEGPLGTFFLREDDDRPIVLVATGTGYAPARSILARALESESTRPMTLYWGAKRMRDLYLLEEATAWAAQHPRFTFVPVLSAPAPDEDWQGRTGYVHRAVADDLPDLSRYAVYASGSPEMVDAARATFTGRSRLPPGQFFADAFVDASYSHSGPAPQLSRTKEESHAVR